MNKSRTLLIVLSSALIALTSLFITLQKSPQQPDTSKKLKIIRAAASTNSVIVVDIEGAIMKPGVYELPTETRLVEALVAAGGLSALADRYIVAKQLNLSKRLTNEEKIYIPYVQETVDAHEVATAPISINNASATELELLPHVGKVTAEKIVKNRPFAELDDLVSKRILSSKELTEIQPLITL